MNKKLVVSSLVFLLSGCGEYEFERDGTSSSNSNLIAPATYSILSPKFDCGEFKEGVKEVDGYGIPFLWETFGTDPSCLKELNEDPKFFQLVVYATNAVCQMNKNCGSYEHLVNESISEERTYLEDKDEEYLNSYRNHLQQLADFLFLEVGIRDGIELIIFPELESNLNQYLHNQLVEIARPIFPGASIGFNPVKKYPIGDADFLSVHRESHEGAPCIANNDGVSISGFGSTWKKDKEYSVEEVQEYFDREGCHINIYWHSRLSNYLQDGEFIDPRDREEFSSSWKSFIDIIK